MPVGSTEIRLPPSPPTQGGSPLRLGLGPAAAGSESAEGGDGAAFRSSKLSGSYRVRASQCKRQGSGKGAGRAYPSSPSPGLGVTMWPNTNLLEHRLWRLNCTALSCLVGNAPFLQSLQTGPLRATESFRLPFRLSLPRQSLTPYLASSGRSCKSAEGGAGAAGAAPAETVRD